MTTSPHLLQMPDVVMNTILRKSDFRSILVLRKVCRDLRNFIDDQAPESHLEHVSISIDANHVHLNMPFNVMEVKYEKGNNGCMLYGRYGYAKLEKFMEGVCFFDLFLNDFQVIMRNQKVPITYFSMHFNFKNDLMLKKLELSMTSWLRPLPIKRLSIRTRSQQEVMSFLPNVDMESLEMFSSNPLKMDISQIVKTDQWRKLKILDMTKLTTSESFSSFGHLQRAMIDREYMMGPDMAELKKIFLTSASLKTFMISTKYVNKPQFDTVLGPSVRENDRLGRQKSIWMCNVPNSKETIQFALYGGYQEWIVEVNRVVE